MLPHERDRIHLQNTLDHSTSRRENPSARVSHTHTHTHSLSNRCRNVSMYVATLATYHSYNIYLFCTSHCQCRGMNASLSFFFLRSLSSTFRNAWLWPYFLRFSCDKRKLWHEIAPNDSWNLIVSLNMVTLESCIV